MQKALIEHFKSYGQSAFIKVDNGRPFGDPQGLRIPPLAMWLIGLGIRVIWNRSRIPQDNAKVERGQGVLNNWCEPNTIPDLKALKDRLVEEAHFQRAIYEVQRLEGQTRMEAFPGLKQPGAPYEPEKFSLQRVLNFLAQGCYERLVSSEGQVSQFGKRFQVGYRYRSQEVSIRLDPNTNQWQVFSRSGEILKTQPTGITAQSVWALEKS